MDLFQAAQNKLQSAQNRIVQTGHSIGEFIVPVLKESSFEDKGVLTPEEFVAAGDQLVRTCPTWQWAAGDPKKNRPYLPADKQYLMTRNVPCLRRVKALELDNGDECEVEGEDGEGWLTTHNNARKTEENDEDIGTIGGDGALQGKVEAEEVEQPKPTEKEDSDEDSYINIDDFVEENLAGQLDDATLQSTTANTNDALIKTRTYDLSITYDKYYQTPRVWLYGYDENSKPLSSEETFEDIMQDYANKTVTIEPHPHLVTNGAQASIHPCRHAKVMKKIIGYLAEGGRKARAEQYLFIFLKFIQSVIPTIDYDYTIEVQAR